MRKKLTFSIFCHKKSRCASCSPFTSSVELHHRLIKDRGASTQKENVDSIRSCPATNNNTLPLNKMASVNDEQGSADLSTLGRLISKPLSSTPGYVSPAS